MSDETITISKIFDKCLIKDNYHSSILEPVTFGNYSFDAGMVDYYGYRIKESFDSLKEESNKKPSDVTKTILLLGAFNKLSKLNISEDEYALAHHYKVLYDDLNSLLKYTKHTCEIIDLNTCIISNSSGDREKMEIVSKPGFYYIEGCVKDDFIYASVGYAEETGYQSILRFENPKKRIQKAIYFDEKSEAVKAMITKFDSRADTYIIEISSQGFKMKTLSRYLENNEEANTKKGDIYRSFLVINDDYQGQVVSEELSFNDDKEYNGGTFCRFKNVDYARQVLESSVENIKDSDGEEIDFEESLVNLTENISIPDYDENIQAMVNNQRVIELFNVIIDQIEENIPDLKDYIFDNYPAIKDYAIGEYSVSEKADYIFEQIYNPECEFGKDSLFEEYEKEK